MTDTDIDTARARWQKRIRELREALPRTGKRPVSRYKLARLIDVSPSTIENWETDGTIPGGETIIRLAAYLPAGWTLEHLLGITDDTAEVVELAGLERDAEAAAKSHARAATRGKSAQSHAKGDPQ